MENLPGLEITKTTNINNKKVTNKGNTKFDQEGLWSRLRRSLLSEKIYILLTNFWLCTGLSISFYRASTRPRPFNYIF